MTRILYRDAVDDRGSVGLLVTRLVCGVGVLLHGWPKMQDPFAWMGPDGILCTMAVAVAMHVSRGDPFVGPGRLSLDAWLFARGRRAGSAGAPGEASTSEEAPGVLDPSGRPM